MLLPITIFDFLAEKGFKKNSIVNLETLFKGIFWQVLKKWFHEFFALFEISFMSTYQQISHRVYSSSCRVSGWSIFKWFLYSWLFKKLILQSSHSVLVSWVYLCSLNCFKCHALFLLGCFSTSKSHPSKSHLNLSPCSSLLWAFKSLNSSAVKSHLSRNCNNNISLDAYRSRKKLPNL